MFSFTVRSASPLALARPPPPRDPSDLQPHPDRQRHSCGGGGLPSLLYARAHFPEPIAYLHGIFCGGGLVVHS